jgi:hypothetical protein
LAFTRFGFFGVLGERVGRPGPCFVNLGACLFCLSLVARCNWRYANRGRAHFFERPDFSPKPISVHCRRSMHRLASRCSVAGCPGPSPSGALRALSLGDPCGAALDYASCTMADDLDCSENDRNDRISITLPRRLRQRLRERAVAALHPEAAEARQLLAWALQSKEERAA